MLLLRLSLLVGCAFMISACGSVPRGPAAPPPIEAAVVGDFNGQQIRYFPLSDPAGIRQGVEAAYIEESPECYELGPSGERIYNYLAVSGGGSDGAFGAGVLNGWSEEGSRPRFKFVTGVSTGALIAPFAFLGKDYDDELKASYTEVDAGSVFNIRGLLSILWSESATKTEPLKNLIARFVDQDLLDHIAIEHKKGRRLYVASTNLDVEMPVIWDMGAIAASGLPDRLTLFRSILLASAAIPSIFPPVMIDVTVDGKPYQELHVDGGVFFQSFSIGATVDLPAAIRAAHPDFNGEVRQNLYIIRNSWVTPAFEPVKRSLVSIAGRAVLSMFKVSGINDLWRLYLSSRDDDVAYRYIAIPAEYEPSTKQQFDKTEMNREYDFGRKMALNGIPWLTEPPGYDAEPSAVSP